MTRPHVGVAVDMGGEGRPFVGLEPDPDDPEHKIVMLTPEDALKVAELLAATANAILRGFEKPLPEDH